MPIRVMIFEDIETLKNGLSQLVNDSAGLESGRILEFIMATYEGGAAMSPKMTTKSLKMMAGKHPDENKDAFNLTDREKEILKCLVQGMSYKMIAGECFISIDTVRTHMKNLYNKLHVHSKGEAISTAFKSKLI
jgi:DNA-binding NarL/FixJ family response regulator